MLAKVAPLGPPTQMHSARLLVEQRDLLGPDPPPRQALVGHGQAQPQTIGRSLEPRDA